MLAEITKIEQTTRRGYKQVHFKVSMNHKEIADMFNSEFDIDTWVRTKRSVGEMKEVLTKEKVVHVEVRKPKGSVPWLVFWIIAFWPIAIIYYFNRRWRN